MDALELDWLADQLSSIYEPNEARLWLFSPHAELDGEAAWAAEVRRRLEDWERGLIEEILVPFWIFEDGPARVERRIPLIPLTREVAKLKRLVRSLAVYRMAFGQHRQEDLMAYLEEGLEGEDGGVGCRRDGRFR